MPLADPNISIEVKGMFKVQRAVRTFVKSVYRTSDATTTAVQRAAVTALDYAVDITHRDTHTLAASHFIEVGQGQALIYVADNVNPKSFENPAIYGVEEHDRGGDHAFYRRTADEHGSQILIDAARGFVDVLQEDLP